MNTAATEDLIKDMIFLLDLLEIEIKGESENVDFLLTQAHAKLIEIYGMVKGG